MTVPDPQSAPCPSCSQRVEIYPVEVIEAESGPVMDRRWRYERHTAEAGELCPSSQDDVWNDGELLHWQPTVGASGAEDAGAGDSAASSPPASHAGEADRPIADYSVVPIPENHSPIIVIWKLRPDVTYEDAAQVDTMMQVVHADLEQTFPGRGIKSLRMSHDEDLSIVDDDFLWSVGLVRAAVPSGIVGRALLAEWLQARTDQPSGKLRQEGYQAAIEALLHGYNEEDEINARNARRVDHSGDKPDSSPSTGPGAADGGPADGDPAP